jgi:hypothetical protein
LTLWRVSHRFHMRDARNSLTILMRRITRSTLRITNAPPPDSPELARETTSPADTATDKKLRAHTQQTVGRESASTARSTSPSLDGRPSQRTR